MARVSERLSKATPCLPSERTTPSIHKTGVMSETHLPTHKHKKKKKRKPIMPSSLSPSATSSPPPPLPHHRAPPPPPHSHEDSSNATATTSNEKAKKRKRPSSTTAAGPPSMSSSPHQAIPKPSPPAPSSTAAACPPSPAVPPATSNKKGEKKKRKLPSSSALSTIPAPTSSSKANPKPPPTRQQHTPATPSLHHYPFPTDYADHFESPFRAYQDLEPYLVWLCRALGKQQNKQALHIYDPYYCQGAVIGLLGRLGFSQVTNKLRDFYADVATKQVPKHDVLVTNPPYSGEHKEKALRFCLASKKPFCLLLPNYVANKAYYLDAIASLPENQKPFYLVPAQKYEYAHPEGTGHESSPFFSVWFCHPGPLWEEKKNPLVPWLEQAAKKNNPPTWRVVLSVEGLRSTGATPSWKRPNNKRRKKMKMMAAAGGGGGGGKG